MDKYDYLILQLLKESDSPMELDQLKAEFWKRLSEDDEFRHGNSNLGERITKLYLDGVIVKGERARGYYLTNNGKREIERNFELNN